MCVCVGVDVCVYMSLSVYLHLVHVSADVKTFTPCVAPVETFCPPEGKKKENQKNQTFS